MHDRNINYNHFILVFCTLGLCVYSMGAALGIHNLYLPWIVFIAQVSIGPSKQLKQIIQIEHNIVKSPVRPEANQLATYKHGRGFELRPIYWEKKIEIVGLNSGRPDWVSVMLPP